MMQTYFDFLAAPGKLPTVRELRQRTGLSQAAFAAAYGIPIRTVQSWENNLRTPPTYVIELLAYAVLNSGDAKPDKK